MRGEGTVSTGCKREWLAMEMKLVRMKEQPR